MYKSVDDYLGELRKALTGSDPATVQDALADAEEHLRTALNQALQEQSGGSESDALQKIIDEYGAPGEVAAAYAELETRTPPPLAPRERRDDRSFASRFFGVFVDPRAYASLFYMFFSMITGVVYFTWAVTGLSLTAGLFILIIGLPFFALFLLSVQGIALVEGRIVEALLGVRMPRRPLFAKGHLGVWERFKALFFDKRSWTSIVYMIAQLPLGTLYFTVFVTLLVFGLAGIFYPVFHFVFHMPYGQFGNVVIYLPGWLTPLFVVVGVLWILCAMHLARYVGRLHGMYAKALLVKE